MDRIARLLKQFDREVDDDRALQIEAELASAMAEFDQTYPTLFTTVPAPTKKKPARSKKLPTVWVAPGDSVIVHGLEITGGFFYFGETLNGTYGQPEPSQVNPSLPVDLVDATSSVPTYYQRESYAELTEGLRARYLVWLAEGNPAPGFPNVFLNIFISGIERRLTVDLLREPELREELPSIRAKLEHLQSAFASTYGFPALVTRMLDLVDALAFDVTGELPPSFPLEEYGPTPLCLYLSLAHCAEQRIPITAELALAWGWYHNYVPKRSAATRCTTEFSRLFAIRFAEAYPKGIPVKVGKRVMKLSYQKRGHEYYSQPVVLDEIPNIYANTGQLRKIAQVFVEVEHELGPFSRAIAGARSNFEKLAAIGTLPRVLIEGFSKQTDKLRKSMSKLLDKQTVAVIPGSELIALWPVSTPGRMTNHQAMSMLKVLGVLGYGVEPDLRFDGPLPTGDGSVALFRQDLDAPEVADVQYSSARIIAHFAAIAVQADGQVSPKARTLIAQYVGQSFSLAPDAEHRLLAHLHWLESKPIKTTGLAQKAKMLSIAGIEPLGRLISTIAAADGGMTPAKVKALGKVYATLELDPALVTSHLHAYMTRQSSRPAREPVFVQSGTGGDAGVAIPPRPKANTAGIALDRNVIAAKMEQSRHVSALLTDIFADDEESPDSGSIDVSSEATNGILDAAHAKLLAALGERDVVSRQEFNALAAKFRLLPDGALDVLNDAAYDVAGDPLLDGEDELTINHDAFEELCR
ncbi:hypothetical protein BH09CHL1_BH09CHL1_16900 [soil metagenome]